MRKEFFEFYNLSDCLAQLHEECDELGSACSKYNRVVYGIGFISGCPFQKAHDNLIEEIADVENCISAIKSLLNIDQDEIDRIIKEKDDRTARRIEESLREGKKARNG